ncbi:phosphatidylinositol 3-kinase catalytic subunit type 3 [Anaeramoeba ignava]|uniref:phosphatidylinositol 3-kinase n=1 Tax=Anaeramoeba ignava TaxID=1746090 RepID=A0A9Q0R9J7_ANAIG|nr:phosphatidylinositol 3-kinase catalytic subunit type 3 [Anaeramoeba ignava]
MSQTRSAHLYEQQFQCSFISSSDVTQSVSIKIKKIQGTIPKKTYPELESNPFLPFSNIYSTKPSNYFVQAKLYSAGKPLCSSQHTRYKPIDDYSWYENLEFPLKYCDCPLDTVLVFTIYDLFAPRANFIIGGTSISLFKDNSRKLRRGEYHLLIYLNKKGDGSTKIETQGLIPKTEQIGRLERSLRRHKRDIFFQLKPEVNWLDTSIMEKIDEEFDKYSEEKKRIFLLVEFPTFRKKIILNETMKYYPQMVIFQEKFQKEPLPPLSLLSGSSRVENDCLWDPEMFKDNPVEMKNRKLSRSRRTGIDRNLKPNSEEIKTIEAIISQPPTKILTDNEKELIWTYRYSLTKNKKALTKFLRCVDWTDKSEEKQAQELITEWAKIDPANALELLSSFFQSPVVRKLGVDRLREAVDDELLEYLPQLVQAIRYEKNPITSDLTTFLIERATKNPILGSYFYWYLSVETQDKEYSNMFTNVLASFKAENAKLDPDGMKMLQRQKEYVDDLMKLQEYIKGLKVSRTKKITKLKQSLTLQQQFLKLNTFDPVRDPLNPNLKISGILPETCHIFKSALQPIAFNLKLNNTEEIQNYGAIIKLGDDMRQDQLIIQMINLMDKLLKKEDLDLELTPYKVLAVSNNFGFIEKVPNVKSVAEILKKYKTIRNYFKKKYSNVYSDYGNDEKKIIQNYVKSCAGYCVITYLLGIGDRHLDNILLTPDGHLFHIDFGFILGRDPKPFPPPFKLSKEMVVAMGDRDSEEFLSFKKYCCEAFNILRKSANLIINLFSLMLDANIPDISRDKENCLMKIQQKYQLDLSNEDAVKYFQELIHESYTSLFPVIVEQFHKIAQAFKG